MNLTDPNIEARAGQAMRDMADEGLTGTMDTPDYGVLRTLTRKLFGLGSKEDVEYTPTDELLKRGQEAPEEKPDTEELGELVDDQVPPDEKVALEPQDGETVNQAGQVLPEDSPVTMDPGLESLTPEQIAAKRQEELEARTFQRNVNLDYVERPEDIGAVLDAAADLLPTRDVEALAEIEASPDWKGLKDWLTEKPDANMTSRQLLAGRRMMVSLADEVDSLAKRITEGDNRAETLLQFEKAQRNLVLLQQTIQGQITEAGRTLNSMKIVANTLNTRDIRSMESMARKSSMSTEQKARYLLEMQQNGQSKAAQIEEMSKLTLNDRLASIINIRTAGLLTGFRTHAINAVSNAGMGAWNNLVVYPTAAVVSPVRQAVMGGGAGVSPQELYVRQAVFMRGLRDAILMASRVFGRGWKSGDYQSSFDGRQKVDETGVGSVPVSEAISLDVLAEKEIPVVSHLAGATKTGMDAYQKGVEALSYGGLSASDEFFKSMAYQQAMTGNAMRQAIAEGLEGDDLMRRTNELLTEPTKEMHEAAMLEAERQTFTDTLKGGFLGNLNESIKGLTREHPTMRIFFPFVNTPTSLVNRAYQNSPMAPFTKEFRERIAKGGADADLAIAQLTAGTALMYAMYSLYHSGMVTGGGPENPKQKAALEKQGWQQNSIRVGNKYVSYDRLDPFGLTIGAITDVLDKAAYSETEADAMDLVGAAAIGIAQQSVDSTWMRGMSDLMLLLDGYRDPTKMGASILASFVPTVFSQAGDVMRDSEQGVPAKFYPDDFWESLGESVQRRLPVASDAMPPKRYWDGSIVTATDGEALYLYNNLSPIRVSSIKNHPASIELAANGVPVSAPTPIVPLGNGMRLDLMADLSYGADIYDEMIRHVGEARLEAVEATMDSDAYVDADRGPGSEQFEMLQRALVKGRKEGLRRFMEWADGEDFDQEKYGPLVQYLNQMDLDMLKEGVSRDSLTEQERQDALDLEAPRVTEKEGLPVPLERREPPTFDMP